VQLQDVSVIKVFGIACELQDVSVIKVSGIEFITPKATKILYGLAHSMSLYLHDFIAGPTSGTVGEALYEY